MESAISVEKCTMECAISGENGLPFVKHNSGDSLNLCFFRMEMWGNYHGSFI